MDSLFNAILTKLIMVRFPTYDKLRQKHKKIVEKRGKP